MNFQNPEWQPAEDAIIRREYPDHGIAGCRKHLARTDRAIYTRAADLGVRSKAPPRGRPALVVRPTALSSEVVQRINTAPPLMPVRLAIDADYRAYITTQQPGGHALQVIPGTVGVYAVGARRKHIEEDIRERLRELSA